jgi:phosphatidylglycerol:prolipoprotein diacylglycerol transferase
MFPNTITLFGMSLHVYGLLIGLSIVAAWLLIKKKADEYDTDISRCMERLLLPVLVSSVLGSRIWHVFTDFHLYRNNIVEVLAIWNGGLSIFGGVLGGAIASTILLYFFSDKKCSRSLIQIFDLVVFGLPFGQALGRWANYFNQELYGLPTRVPWAIHISPSNRVSGFEQYALYHPLFLYELLALFGFGCIVWWHSKSKYSWSIGSSRYTLLYLLFYSLWRFLLDFIRIQKTVIAGTQLGVNQGILLLVFIASAVLISRVQYRKRS